MSPTSRVRTTLSPSPARRPCPLPSDLGEGTPSAVHAPSALRRQAQPVSACHGPRLEGPAGTSAHGAPRPVTETRCLLGSQLW